MPEAFPPPEQRSYSQAMRCGARMIPRQAFRVARTIDGATDANQAAIDGGGIMPPDLKLRWPIISLRCACPECYRLGKLLEVVNHLNDEHRWTRERIADFVEARERANPQLCPAPVEPIPVERPPLALHG